MEEKINWVENTKTEATRVVDEWTDINGRKHRVVEREQVAEPLDLGSINNPKNTDVVEIKMTIPKDLVKQIDKYRVDFSKMFGQFKC